MKALLDGKTCVVSGVGPGLGQAAARALASHGANVVLAARTKSYLDEVAAAIGERAHVVPTDVTESDQCRRLVEAAVDRFGALDVLVNSAFRPDVFRRFEDVDLGAWREIFEVNVWGTLQLTQAAVPQMKDRGGSIVFVNSMVVRHPQPRQAGYGASKGALLVAAQGLANELGQYNIRVNSVVPGWMLGPPVEMYLEYQANRRGVTRDEILAERNSHTALNRIPTQEEAASAVVFLASDLSSGMTGQSIDVNGGERFH